MAAERSPETERLFKEHADYIAACQASGMLDPKRLAELHQAVVASAQRDYERSKNAGKPGEAE